MAKIEMFEDLEVWQEAVRVGVKVYELYNSNPAFQKFLTYAKGSAGELRSELIFLKEAEVISKEDYETLAPELMKVSRSISGFKKYLREFESKKVSKSSNL